MASTAANQLNFLGLFRARMATIAGLVILLGVAFTTIGVSPAAARGAPDGFADLAERLSPAVVNISTTQEVQALGNLSGALAPLQKKFSSRQASSLGSGFIIDPRGIVVTNNHVIQNAVEIKVNLSDGREFKAKVRGVDQETDLAVLEIESDGVRFPHASWGDSDKSRVGEWVVAIGNPFGLGGSVSAGIISAINRNIASGDYDDYIQTDAAINRGNSGGPLFNMQGDVIGVNTAIYSQTGGSVGVGFSIPSDLAAYVVGQLLEFGETRRGYLGVGVSELTNDQAREAGFDRPRGAFVTRVTPQSPAARAGIEARDIIISFNRIAVNNSRELTRAVAETPVGATVPVVLVRSRKRMTVQVTVDRRETNFLSEGLNGGLPKNSVFRSSGLTLEEPTEAIINSFGLPRETKGAVVTAVDPHSEAFAILQPGDVILEIGWERVSRAQGAVAKLQNLHTQNGGPVQIRVRRGDLLFYEMLRP
ncbi:MAG: Do family serine endopeptidase [Pseudomonadota bacterium]